jgi:hypothetical protein
VVVGQFDLLPLIEGVILSLRRIRRGAGVQPSQHLNGVRARPLGMKSLRMTPAQGFAHVQFRGCRKSALNVEDPDQTPAAATP